MIDEIWDVILRFDRGDVAPAESYVSERDVTSECLEAIIAGGLEGFGVGIALSMLFLKVSFARDDLRAVLMHVRALLEGVPRIAPSQRTAAIFSNIHISLVGYSLEHEIGIEGGELAILSAAAAIQLFGPSADDMRRGLEQLRRSGEPNPERVDGASRALALLVDILNPNRARADSP